MAIRLGQELYYMVHYDNLRSILANGILCHTAVNKAGLARVDISNHDVQSRRARREPVFGRCLHDYVPLYFNPRNPMLYCLREMQHRLVILVVSADVAHGQTDVLYSDGNAACARTRFSGHPAIVNDSADVLQSHSWTQWVDGKRRRCAEMLVHGHVPPEHITGIACSNQFLAMRVQRQHARQAVVAPELFF